MYNRIEIIGHLGREPEMSYTPSGRALTKFSVATSRKWTDTASGEKKEHTDWFNVVAWGPLAETCNTYLHKGSKIFASGRMESRKYTDKDNIERTGWDVVLSDMVMLDGKPSGESTGKGDLEANPDAPDGIPF